MEIGWICATAALALAATILLLKWVLLRASLREVSRELAEKLRTLPLRFFHRAAFSAFCE